MGASAPVKPAMPVQFREETVEALKASYMLRCNSQDWLVFYGGTNLIIRIFLGQEFYEDYITQDPDYVDKRRAEIKSFAGLKAKDPKVASLHSF